MMNILSEKAFPTSTLTTEQTKVLYLHPLHFYSLPRSPALGMKLLSHTRTGCPPVTVAPYGHGSFPLLSLLWGCILPPWALLPIDTRGSIPSQDRVILHWKAGICAWPGMLPPLE